MKRVIAIILGTVGIWAVLNLGMCILGIIGNLLVAVLPVVGVGIGIAGIWWAIDKYIKPLEETELVSKITEKLNKSFEVIKKEFNNK